jgi:hypothetical protein
VGCPGGTAGFDHSVSVDGIGNVLAWVPRRGRFGDGRFKFLRMNQMIQ